MAHLQTNNLLSVNRHGFRSGFSCETQLILTVHDLLESFEHKHRVDIGVLDFSKAFDTVPSSSPSKETGTPRYTRRSVSLANIFSH